MKAAPILSPLPAEWWRGMCVPLDRVIPDARAWLHPDLPALDPTGVTINTGALNLGTAVRQMANAQHVEAGVRAGVLYAAERPGIGLSWAFLTPRLAESLSLLSAGRWVSTETFRQAIRADGRSAVSALRMAGLIVATRVPDQDEAEWRLYGRAYVGPDAAGPARGCPPLSSFLPPLELAVQARRQQIETWRGRKLSASAADFAAWASTVWATDPTNSTAPGALPI